MEIKSLNKNGKSNREEPVTTTYFCNFQGKRFKYFTTMLFFPDLASLGLYPTEAYSACSQFLAKKRSRFCNLSLKTKFS